MQVQIKTYGLLRDRVGKNRIVDLPETSRIIDLLEQLAITDAKIWILRVNGELSDYQTELKDGAIVEIVPPSAGG